MTSRTTDGFRRVFRRLPAEVQEQARNAYRMFRQTPYHPSLNFERILRTDSVYSARVGRRYRALCTLIDDQAIWFFIGPHAEYDRLIENL